MGGGPIKGGRVVGESDEMGYAAEVAPSPRRESPRRSIALGIDPHKELPGPQNRPMPLADFNVQPIGELI